MFDIVKVFGVSTIIWSWAVKMIRWLTKIRVKLSGMLEAKNYAVLGGILMLEIKNNFFPALDGMKQSGLDRLRLSYQNY